MYGNNSRTDNAISLADNLKVLFLSIAIITLIVTGIALIPIVIECEWKNCKNYIETAVGIAFICAILGTAIPSKKTIAAMYIVPKIANNEKINNIADNSLVILESLTKEWLQNLVKNNKENK